MPAQRPANQDLAEYYRDDLFPGRRLLSWSVGLWLVASVIPMLVSRPSLIPEWLEVLRTVSVMIAVPLYFLGFWSAVVGKGYPRILFLMAFAPFLGLIIIYFLPSRSAQPITHQANGEQGVAPNP